MDSQYKRYGGKIFRGDHGLAKFVDVRGMAVILAFSFSMVLQAGISSSEDEVVIKLINYCMAILVTEAVGLFFIGFLGEALPTITIGCIALITGISIGIGSTLPGPFFHGKDLVLLFNLIIVYLTHDNFSKSKRVNA